jgi:hypothetical protein
MKKYLLAAAAVAALSTAAFARDSKPVQMTDEQMDKVTAGQIDLTLSNYGQARRNGTTCCIATNLNAKPNESALGSHQGQDSHAARLGTVD